MKAALANVLRTRFGETSESIRSQVEAADLKTLQRYHDRAITAQSVDEVFEV
ncbi:MAG: hypothetical protein V2A76_03535 [Planctomycetota bacterium]